MAKKIEIHKEGKHGLQVTQASDVTSSSIHIKADAVIVGSGAGGAVTAYELASKGKKVVVLEAGPYVPSEKFTEMLAMAMGTLYQDHGGQNNADGDIAILQGSCVGGSTVVNAAFCVRTPDYYLKLWAKEFGTKNLTSQTLKPYFEKVEANLSIRPNAPHETSAGAELIKAGLKKLGLPLGNARRNVKDCGLTGFCFSGCVADRKQSMLVTYLPWAVEKGANIFADTRVINVLTENGVAKGVVGEVIDPSTGKKKADIQIDAPIVVLAAGPIQTPLLLLKNGLANSSGQVGKNFACHPTMSLTAEFDKETGDFHGATHSLSMDKNVLPESGGYVLLNAVQDPVEASFQVEPGTGKPYVHYMSRYKNTIRLITLIHDKNHGEVRWMNGQKNIKYAVDNGDFDNMKKGLKTNARVLFASGAKRVYIPTSQKLIIENVSQVDAVIDSLKNDPARYRYTSFHPQGTCRMGADAKRSVVNPYGESHDVKNLYIVDASILPTSHGYPTSLSVYAISTYIAEHINKAHA